MNCFFFIASTYLHIITCMQSLPMRAWRGCLLERSSSALGSAAGSSRTSKNSSSGKSSCSAIPVVFAESPIFIAQPITLKHRAL